MNLFHGASKAVQALDNEWQGNRLLILDFPRKDAPDSILLANTLVADEALSRDFEYTVEVLSDDATIDLDDVIGKMVTVSLICDNGSRRYFNGYVFEFAFVRTDGGFAFYRMVLKPWLAFLKVGRNSVAWHAIDLKELVDAVFNNYLQRDYNHHLIDPSPRITLAVQHNESDHNHLYRRLEAAGYVTWYEHRFDGHTFWYADNSTLCEMIDGDGDMVFQSEAGAQEGDGIAQWHTTRRVTPQRATVNSYEFKIASTQRPCHFSALAQDAIEPLEVYEDLAIFGFRGYQDGALMAQRRMEMHDAPHRDHTGSGNDRRLHPARQAGLRGYVTARKSNGATVADGVAGFKYLILEVSHSASNNYQHGKGSPSFYRNHFKCVRNNAPWRPPIGFNSLPTRIDGVQTARVVGAPGEEIHTDQYGRIRLQFHWDRLGKFNANSSPWVRVASAWAGSRFGQVGIPRVGQEVVVMFIDGNPDLPLVIGSLYNGGNMPPWALPANKTQSGILTRSSGGGTADHANALRFEDLKGHEEVWLHAERDQRIEVEHDESHRIGHDRRKTVDHDETVCIRHDRTETVDNDERITVHGKRSERVDHDEYIDIGGARIEHVADHEQVTVAKSKEENVMLAKSLAVGGLYQITVGGAMNTVVAGSQFEIINACKSTNVADTYAITAGSSFEITVGAATFKLTSDGAISINGTRIDMAATGALHINGKDVDIN